MPENNSEFKKLSDDEFMKQLAKQISDVKNIFTNYEKSKNNG